MDTAAVLMILASIALAVAVCVLLVLRDRRAGTAPGGGLLAAVLVGVLVLGLGLLNVLQFGIPRMTSAADVAAAPSARRVRPEPPAPARSTTLPFLASAEEQDLVDRFARLFYHTEGTWQERKWLGIRTLQNPNDVWIHQELIVELKPDYIIEAGTAHGGSALLWSMILEQVNPDAKVITMDIGDPDAAAMKQSLWTKRVEFIKGSSTDPATVARIGERVRGKRVLVILDSDHRKPHVLDELRAYSPMVNVGGYLIVQDTSVNGHPVDVTHGPGPMEALDEFLASTDQFEVDRSRESLLFTLHPRGYLKRVK